MCKAAVEVHIAVLLTIRFIVISEHIRTFNLPLAYVSYYWTV